jgi:predicted nucleotidyltransferase
MTDPPRRRAPQRTAGNHVSRGVVVSVRLPSVEFVSVNSYEPDRRTALRVAREHCVLRGLVGSTVHGPSNPGTDDRDEMGVCVEPAEYVLGLRRFEHCVARTQPEGVPSGPGDVDLTIYGLRKFCRLASKGSPTVLLLFFVCGDDVLERSELGDRLQAMAPAFLSRRTGRAFLGYLDAQARSLRGERHATRTRELSATHGYDTKFAMHALRIGYQGIELLQTGSISLPMREPIRGRLRTVRADEPPLDEVLAELDDVTQRLNTLAESADLSDTPDATRIDAFLAEAYRDAWDGRR